MENSSHPYAVTVVNYLSCFKMSVVSILVWLCQLQLTVIESASFGGDMQTYPLWGPYAQSSCIGDEYNRNKRVGRVDFPWCIRVWVPLAWCSSHHRPVLLVSGFFQGGHSSDISCRKPFLQNFYPEYHPWPTDILNSSFLQKLCEHFYV